MNEKYLALMDDLMMNAITQLDEWQELQMHDPRITAASDRFDAALERVRDLIPKDTYAELADAYSSGLSATGDAGILFGVHLSDVIRDVASRPADLSRYILNRIERRTTA